MQNNVELMFQLKYCEKWENSAYQHILLLTQCFPSYQRHLTCCMQMLSILSSLKYFNPFPHYDTFWHPWETSLLKTLGKGEIARDKQFLLFQQCFLPAWITFFQFSQLWNCRLQTLSVWKSLKFVVW